VYAEAVAMVEEYHAAGGAGAGKKLNCSPQVLLLLSDKSSFFIHWCKYVFKCELGGQY
jgi:hypothetical protein